MHHALRVSRGMRPTLYAGVDFTLVRFAGGGKDQEVRKCISNTSVLDALPAHDGPVWPGMRGLCPAPGNIACEGTSLRCAVAPGHGESVVI